MRWLVLLLFALVSCYSRLPDIAEEKDVFERSYEAMVTWDPVPEAIGYRVYAGRTSRSESDWTEYEIVRDAGSTTFYIFSPIFKHPARYYFAGTAYSSESESDYSEEVSKFLD